MTKVTIPEPVAWTLTVGEDFANCIEITHCKEDVDAQYEASTEGGYEDLYLLRPLITADQAETYKDACVREALEEAINLSSMYGATIELDAAIRDLIPPSIKGEI